MPDAPDKNRKVSWKQRDKNQIIGTEVARIDGQPKASGTAKYSADINTKGTLFAKVLTCKHGHAKIVKLDTAPAKKSPGVHAVHEFVSEGDELLWDGSLVAAVAAERPELADDALRAIKVEYEVLDHFVDEDNLEQAEELERTNKPRESTKGDVEVAFKDAKAVHEGYYGVSTITHSCMEPHGSHCEWDQNGNGLKVHLSTQNVSGTAGQFAGPLGIDASSVEIICDYIGGGFGSKFQADEWGVACAKMAKEADRPVRLMLDRATELKIAGTRPSCFGKVKIAADADGKIVAWDSEHWGTNGMRGGTVDVNQMPYVFDFDNRNRKAVGLKTNSGPTRAWRAPNHPQLCAMTCTAIDDLAAKLGMDTLDVILKNLDKTPRPEVYKAELDKAAELIDWKDKWHPHGKGESKNGVKRGLGVAIHQWGGRPHAASCLVKVNPDGTVESTAGSQDIGTGTRTAIGIVLAETFGIPLDMVKVNIGSSKYPRSGPSGGSTTIGGVSGPNRQAALEALWQIFDKVAKKYDADPETLEAVDGKIVSGDKVVCSWKDAARLTGPMGLEVTGKGPVKELTDDGVGGVQMAEVSVDTETGKVKVEKFVAVQDCGMIINEKAARSQIEGGMIMGIAYALTEERIMDPKSGRFINADFENYKLPRLGDIGELVVEIHQPDDIYERGVIGLGEPPVISPGAAISNAVANAIGVRVPVLPMTPKRVLDALEGANA
ncbi:xanthine dehydrogenase family protein molybdopterin-binding subunit [Thalassoroseus pseudoceratinae]|uniref:xanthine dehydrogenase family protein molybdopterin-binding subunit n=1 Tax=Thalassoroseus pseudoceratinae TaxID=2713176 RepID=UPI001421F1D5|nr:xanthine dehydrogenase family protein molybdopterin-binding subunit [Thalassoroseus pseudoceratinae]